MNTQPPSKFCVDCGEKNIPTTSYNTRCPPCLQAFKDKGGITTSKEPIRESPSGMRLGGRTIYHNFARFCRLCGKKLSDAHYGSRVLYALNRGGECVTCDDCAWKKKMQQ